MDKTKKISAYIGIIGVIIGGGCRKSTHNREVEARFFPGELSGAPFEPQAKILNTFLTSHASSCGRRPYVRKGNDDVQVGDEAKGKHGHDRLALERADVLVVAKQFTFPVLVPRIEAVRHSDANLTGFHPESVIGGLSVYTGNCKEQKAKGKKSRSFHIAGSLLQRCAHLFLRVLRKDLERY